MKAGVRSQKSESGIREGRTCLRLALVAGLLMCGVAFGAEGLRIGPEMELVTEGPGQGLQATPAVAAGKDGYLVTWREGWNGAGGRARIFAARVDASGKCLDPKGIEVAPCEQGLQERPRVAFGAGVYLVVWQEMRGGSGYDICAARVSVEGKVLDTAPLALERSDRSQVLPDVASDGKGFVVVWQGLKGEETQYRGYSALVGADGHVAPPVELANAAPEPKIAWGCDHYLVTFGTLTVSGLRLKPDGTPEPSKASEVLSGRMNHEHAFSIAGSPAGWILLDHRSKPDYWGWGGPGAIRAFLVGPNGALSPDNPKEENTPQNRQANWLDMGKAKQDGATWPYGANAVAWDGSQFIAIWQRHHIEKTVMFKNCDLMASRMEGSKPLDIDAVVLADSGCDERNPVLASNGAGELVCAYEKYGTDGRVSVRCRTLKAR